MELLVDEQCSLLHEQDIRRLLNYLKISPVTAGADQASSEVVEVEDDLPSSALKRWASTYRHSSAFATMWQAMHNSRLVHHPMFVVTDGDIDIESPLADSSSLASPSSEPSSLALEAVEFGSVQDDEDDKTF